MPEEKIEYMLIPKATLGAILDRLGKEPYASVAGLVMAIHQHVKEVPVVLDPPDENKKAEA